MANPFEDDDGMYQVIVNAEGQPPGVWMRRLKVY